MCVYILSKYSLTKNYFTQELNSGSFEQFIFGEVYKPL